jgi:arsenate reductase
MVQPLGFFIQTKATNQQQIRLNLICTHTIQESHLSQVWAQTAAAYFNIKMCSAIPAEQETTTITNGSSDFRKSRLCR